MIPSLIAIYKLTIFALFTIIVTALQIPVLLINRILPMGQIMYILPRFWHRGTCIILRINVAMEGSPSSSEQTLFLSNHISYFDINVIGSVLKASFIAKEDVANWPVFGFLSKLQHTAFISRSRQTAKVGANALTHMIEDGKNLILFPEGTSTDGQKILPFRSSLLSIAYSDHAPQDLMVQPLTLQIVSTNGKLIEDGGDRDIYAWHGDMTMAPHLWNFAKSSGATIKLVFHAPLTASDFNDRKTLAHKCHDVASSV